MAWVTPHLISIWNSGEHIGENTPKAVVQVQRGYWQRDWRPWSGPAVHAQIWGEGGYGDSSAQAGYWFPVWVPTTLDLSNNPTWIDVPHVVEIKLTKDLAQNGVVVAEVILDAMDYDSKVGLLGDAYHVLSPGFLAPTRGYVPPTRPDPGWQATQWEGVITDSVKIRIWQGFGDPETSGGKTPPTDGGTNGAWTYAGQIDDVDVDSGDSSGGNPNQISITARNGKLLTDQRTFGWAKSRRLNDPVTFYDNLAATSLTMVGSAASASSSDPTGPPSNVLDVPANTHNIHDPAYQTKWYSGSDIDASNLEWVDIRLPQGTYDEFWLNSLAGMFAYVGIFAHSIVHWAQDPSGSGLTQLVFPSRMDGQNIPVGWVDLGHGSPPGANGAGWTWIKSFKTGQKPSPALPRIDRPHLGHSFDLGHRSILRVGFINQGGSVVADVADLHGLKRQLVTGPGSPLQQRFILVNDASEAVKVVLRWAGFQEWDVEQALVRLSGRLVFNRSTHLIDIVNEVAKQLGFIFFIADPTDGDSDGVPTFRRDSSLLKGNNYVPAALNDDNMLTNLQTKDTDENRPFIIRVRGKTAATSGGGVPLGGDTIRRLMAVYVPPWAFGDRAGGIVRHITYQDDQIISYAMCLFGCYLIALQAALDTHTVVATIPAHPLIELDDQVSVIDEPTGTNSRMWVVKSTSTMTLGDGGGAGGGQQGGLWTQTLEGALLDTQDMYDVLNGATPSGHGHVFGVLEIDWNNVVDPNVGDTSGYMSPVLVGVSRQPRTR